MTWFWFLLIGFIVLEAAGSVIILQGANLIASQMVRLTVGFAVMAIGLLLCFLLITPAIF